MISLFPNPLAVRAAYRAYQRELRAAQRDAQAGRQIRNRQGLEKTVRAFEGDRGHVLDGENLLRRHR